jgi:phage-related protein
MPATQVLFYREEEEVPALDFLLSQSEAVQKASLLAITRLEELGHELRRPEAAFLEEGIHELRIRVQRQQYRLLYFFWGQNAVVLAHGLRKEQEIPRQDLRRAKARRERFVTAPEEHFASI